MKHTMMAAGLFAGAVAAAAPALAQDNDPYAPYRGTTIVVSFPAHPHYDATLEVLDQFTEETGIIVEVDQLGYLKMRERQNLVLTRPTGDYDLIAYVVFSKADYVAAGQLRNLAPFFMDPRLADPNYDPEDLIPAYVQNIGQVGGKLGYLPGPMASVYGVPFGSETSILGYRKDIFEKHGLKVPETYDEMLELACKIPELEPGMGGLASRAASGHHASHAFLLHLAPLGGRVLDAEWGVTVNSEAGVKAAEALKTIVECGPEGAESYGFGEALGAFLQGKTAMYLDTTAVAGQIEDPTRSKVVGKVGWAPHPMGVRRGSQTGGFGLGIPTNAQNPEAAFLLMQWLTSKKGDKLVAIAGGNPSRVSTHKDPEVLAVHPQLEIFGQALEHADPNWRPIIPVWGQINADLGTTLSKVLTEGLDPKEALDGVAERATGVLDEAGYYTWR